MNFELAYSILEILQTMQEAVNQMQKSFAAGAIEQFNSMSMDLWDGLNAVQQTARQEVPEGSRIRLADACTCAMESLKDIKILAVTKPEKVEWKLEYELAAIIETAALQFYYWAIVEERPEKRGEFLKFVADTDTFGVLKTPEEEREFSVDLVISVTAYNHLEYTVQCVQSILKELPTGIKSELLLFNHGSTDDTKAFFESVEGAKVINVAVNGVMPYIMHKAISRGRYALQISNDIILGKNSIENLFRCAMEHDDYGYIVPTTPAVSNLQTIPVNYHDQVEFERFAAENNIYDEKRHEQRVRLCNPLHIMPIVPHSQMLLDMYADKCKDGANVSFPDDKNSLWMRRNGYKCILAKDAYCHHFGSVTLKYELGALQEQQRFYDKGRADFEKEYGVDPWGTGFCYDSELFQNWRFPVVDNASVLGINCGLGSNSLKVKEILREEGALGVVLHNATQESRYLQDLHGVSDETFLFSDAAELAAKLKKVKYSYIVIEEEISGYAQDNPLDFLNKAELEFDELAYKTSQGDWKIFRKNQDLDVCIFTDESSACIRYVEAASQR